MTDPPLPEPEEEPIEEGPVKGRIQKEVSLNDYGKSGRQERNARQTKEVSMNDMGKRMQAEVSMNNYGKQ